MATQFEEGRYLVRVQNQYFTEAKTGTKGFALAFRVIHNVNQPETAVKSYSRDLIWWISKDSAKRALHDLHTLGYEGADFTGLHPKTENFYDFSGREIELICTHEKNDRGIFESWNLENSKPKLEDLAELDDLNRLLNPKPARVNSGREIRPRPDAGNQGITDDDVPF